MVKHIALIWGNERGEPTYSTHHSFWEETIKDRPDLKMHRFTWADWESMPLDFDLYIFLDFHRSLFKVAKYNFHPRVVYWWDAFHETFVYPAQLSEVFDKAYYAEYLTATALKSNGYHNVEWLPPAFYPKLYRPIKEAEQKLWDFAFVGQQDTVVTRKGLTRWEFLDKTNYCPPLKGYIGQNIFGDTVNQVYNQTKILFDRTVFNNIGTRFFETIGSGGFLLMNRTRGYNGIDQLAKDGIHYVSYDDSFPDFEYKLRYYVNHPEERERIAKAGRQHFLDHHTYNHRLDVILRDAHLL